VEPSRGQAEGQTEEVLEEENPAGILGLAMPMGGSETDGKKLGPMEGCGGSLMLRSERRGREGGTTSKTEASQGGLVRAALF